MILMGLNDKARKKIGWSTFVFMGNYAYVKIGDKELGLREWVDNVDKEVWREVVQNVLYDDRGESIIWTCLEEYRDKVRECQWECTICL